MSTEARTSQLNALADLAGEDRYLLANARCLSEGIDVPALDGVAFILLYADKNSRKVLTNPQPSSETDAVSASTHIQ